jgi:hypothetical protein
MKQQDFCQDCHYKHDCREIYRQLGHSSCPSVVRKVIVAFLLPLVVFIISLAVFNEIFARAGGLNLLSSQDGNPSNMQELKVVVCFLMALFTTSVCVFIIKMIDKRLHKVL